ncbi:ankyrin repeat and LEM domain-containing protein 2-like [Dendronephthya gigantea]|uniref:ankyrin repeat and LEM domain-containing protein 2-like n=1 Tax=Dendronephthya gigantea TaxID=151771 RepID=UPI00106D2687|nr:ankyrin repeat and LEM domain-containing protein 2-like [Dendronephthya gigantea]
MHVAAKTGQKDICELIIETLNDDEFWKLIYPNKEKGIDGWQKLNNRRKAFTLDLYLNTPDRGSCETPLHFACKFGKADVVKYLLSCSGVERSVLNKDRRTAEEVICARVPNCDEDLRSRIQSMFDKQESVCVPILRSDDNCAPPKVGAPWSPSCHMKFEEAVGKKSWGTNIQSSSVRRAHVAT